MKSVNKNEIKSFFLQFTWISRILGIRLMEWWISWPSRGWTGLSLGCFHNVIAFIFVLYNAFIPLCTMLLVYASCKISHKVISYYQ